MRLAVVKGSVVKTCFIRDSRMALFSVEDSRLGRDRYPVHLCDALDVHGGVTRCHIEK